MWLIGHVVPQQTQQLKEIGFGLGMGTAQGRVGKVLVAKKYLEHTTAANKFNLFFRHEYMHLILLSVYDPEEDNCHCNKESYFPPGVQGVPLATVAGHVLTMPSIATIAATLCVSVLRGAPN